jgi:diguanylate cyclase (GGDEF)-like protein
MITQTRRTFVGACVPILVLTASDEESVLLDCFRQGADDFMVKPFSISELRTRVSSIYLRQKVARDMNPLTRLPGNLVIKRAISLRLKAGEPFAVAYIDLDHFKPFNDSKGFDAGDRAIVMLSELLRGYAGQQKSGEVFIGHVGGDDFVLIMPPEDVQRMAATIHSRWREAIYEFYSKEDLERGLVDVLDRKGDPMTVPPLSLSIGVLLSQRNGLDDLRKIAQVAAEVKKMAKAIPGNSLFIDRRTKYP